MKSLLYRESGRYINDVYVDIPLKSSKEEVNSKSLIKLISDGYSKEIISANHILVYGIGGSGKSILMKKLFLDFIVNCDSDHFFIPILIRLKSLKINDESFLQKYILTYFSEMNVKFEADLVELFLDRGNIILQFDGLDELKFNEKNKFMRELENFIKKYQKTSIIMSTRPESVSNTLPDFKQYRMQRMSKKQVKEYIEKLPFATNREELLEKILEPNYFKKHEELVGHPLVLAILILTFDYNGELPINSANFYSKVYQTMLVTHDKEKEEGFDRGIATNLSHAKLERFFEIFCFKTYIDEQYSFDLSEINYYIDDAITKFLVEQEGEFDDLTRENIQRDLTHLLCFLIEEGTHYDFIHRTFQEFYAAKFILSLDDDMQKNFFSVDNNIIFIVRGGVLHYLRMLNEKKYLYTAISPIIEDLVVIYDSYTEKVDFIRDNIDVIDLGKHSIQQYYVIYEAAKYSTAREEVLDINKEVIDFSSVEDISETRNQYANNEFNIFEISESEFDKFKEIFIKIVDCEIEYLRKWLSDYYSQRKDTSIYEHIFEW
nr:NACHT domain-containing protein [Enterococcus sp. DIV0869a]